MDSNQRHVVRRSMLNSISQVGASTVGSPNDFPRLCGRRLHAIVSELPKSPERHDHLERDPIVRELLLMMIAPWIDRLLRSIQSLPRGRVHLRSNKKIRSRLRRNLRGLKRRTAWEYRD